ncbi:MAG: MBL fold metallo-hydrolase [Gemmatimonadetes bacterium]|nr:MBL fold metallo-hydrolase [Gemmatimonadota bacterium]
MAAASPTIVNVGYRSTNYWVVSVGTSRLLVDLGWPGLFGSLEAELKRMDVPLKEITHGLATHYHMDHAGAAQDLKNKGMRLIVTAEQVNAIPLMKQFMKPDDNYTEIALNDNAVITCEESRAFLGKLGFDGKIVHTPGHSDDSVSLVLGSGEVFTGDLTHPGMATEEAAETVAQSWQRLRDHGAKMVYAGHGPVRPMPGDRQGE